MPYEVEQPPAGDNVEPLLDERERSGWTLVHIVQGFSQVNESGDTVLYRPRYIFHKP